VTLSGLVTDITPPLSLVALATLLMVNILFYFLMGAPTQIGRRRMDEIEGLRTYLKVAEADRLNMTGVPEMSPQHYETLLPYAIALGVEKPWSKSFQKWLAAAWQRVPRARSPTMDQTGTAATATSKAMTSARPWAAWLGICPRASPPRCRRPRVHRPASPEEEASPAEAVVAAVVAVGKSSTYLCRFSRDSL
jgi:hypothetical protein